MEQTLATILKDITYKGYHLTIRSVEGGRLEYSATPGTIGMGYSITVKADHNPFDVLQSLRLKCFNEPIS
jgi:hypothetical protein